MEVPNLPEVPAKMLEAVPEVPDRRIASDEEVVVVTVVALAQEVHVAAQDLGHRARRNAVLGHGRIDPHDQGVGTVWEGGNALDVARIDLPRTELGPAAFAQAVDIKVVAARGVLRVAKIEQRRIELEGTAQMRSMARRWIGQESFGFGVEPHPLKMSPSFRESETIRTVEHIPRTGFITGPLPTNF